MKKTVFFLCFFALTVSAFTQANNLLFIEGTAPREDQRDFFLNNFTLEARTAGFTVTRTKQEAAHTFNFAVVPNMIWVQGVQRPAPPGDSQFVLQIGLTNNKTGEEVLSFSFYFSELIEMFEHTQFIVYRATINIPTADVVDRNWQYKWLYLRTSFNYPITFNELQPKGLIGGQGVYKVYEGTDDDPGEMSIIDNIIMPQPGITLGLELLLFKFMSLEGNFQVSMGNTQTYSFINWAAGSELKFIIRSKHIMYQPYGAFRYQLNTASIYKDYPVMSFGGGMQVAARGGSSGAIFVDANYMYSWGDVVRKNWFGDLYPNPELIYYNRYVIGLGLGYKYGSFNRKR